MKIKTVLPLLLLLLSGCSPKDTAYEVNNNEQVISVNINNDLSKENQNEVENEFEKLKLEDTDIIEIENHKNQEKETIEITDGNDNTAESIKSVVINFDNLEWESYDIEVDIYIRVDDEFCVRMDSPDDIKTIIGGIQNCEESYIFTYDTSIVDGLSEMVNYDNEDLDSDGNRLKIAKLISWEKQ